MDALTKGIASPVPVTIAGRECKLAYPMHAAIVYRAETARIERSRPQPEDPDPKCVCGAAKSLHVGPGLIRVTAGDAPELLCPRFRKEDPLFGESLFTYESWLRIDLNSDPERWTACLWAGLYELQPDKETWRVPFTLAELQASLGISAETRAIDAKMREAMIAWWPKPKKETPDPNAQPAPGASPVPESPTTVAIATSSGSTPAPADASA